jgi:hypothetical protein
VSQNTDAGVTGMTGARVSVVGAVIDDNGGNGLWLMNGAVGELTNGNTFQGNGMNGIDIADNSSITGGSDNTITDNSKWGIHCAKAPAAALVDGSLADMGTFDGNPNGPSDCYFTQS